MPLGEHAWGALTNFPFFGIFRFSKSLKVAIQVTFDFGVALLCGLVAGWAFPDGSADGPHWLFASAASAAALVLALASAGFYASVVRFFTERSALIVGSCAVLSATIWSYLLGGQVPLSAPAGVVYAIAIFVAIFGARLGVRTAYRHYRGGDAGIVRAVIYGAGSAGRQLAAALGPDERVRVIGFVDDDASLWHRDVAGLKVYRPSEISRLVSSAQVDEVILALPALTRNEHLAIVAQLSGVGVRVRSAPRLRDLLTGKAALSDLAVVHPHDVLQREAVSFAADALKASVGGRNILVTGAGGSIGSELCRQILRASPKRLVMLDQCEQALFHIDHELRQIADGVAQPVLGSASDVDLVRSVLAEAGIDVIFHAAAYKHVPLVENNPVTGLSNNILCTKVLLEALAGSRVSAFTLVSTDKAVRPTSVMGASKRVTELMVQAAAETMPDVHMSIVRFGNVLGSSGSVLPLFQAQIRAGGPVTVTDPEVMRYFMTIPEAAQLILVAGALGSSGSVYHLDMGEPVRIVDLAKRLIRLNGLRERDADGNGDIPIKFIGLRPGEKLKEELLIAGDVLKTAHRQIFQARERFLPANALKPVIDALLEAIAQRNEPVLREILSNIVEEFPAGQAGDRGLGQAHADPLQGKLWAAQ